ncbi:hypothetical protein FRC04_005970, partial [Tulasnella sp. 424]
MTSIPPRRRVSAIDFWVVQSVPDRYLARRLRRPSPYTSPPRQVATTVPQENQTLPSQPHPQPSGSGSTDDQDHETPPDVDEDHENPPVVDEDRWKTVLKALPLTFTEIVSRGKGSDRFKYRLTRTVGAQEIQVPDEKHIPQPGDIFCHLHNNGTQ